MSAVRPGRRPANDVGRVMAYDCQVQDMKPGKKQPEGMRQGRNHARGCGRAHLQVLVHGGLKAAAAEKRSSAWSFEGGPRGWWCRISYHAHVKHVPFPVPVIPSVRPSGPSILAGAVGGAPGTARTHPVVRRDRQSKKLGVLCGLDSRIGQIGLRRATAMQWPTSCRSGLPPR